MYDFAGYSKRHCERLFGELTGRTIGDYIRMIRLSDSAERLLGNKQKSVLEIALDTQFETHEGYTRAFAKKFGITPGAYRNDRHTVVYTISGEKLLFLPISKGEDENEQRNVGLYGNGSGKAKKKVADYAFKASA